MIQVGDTLPNVTVKAVRPEGTEDAATHDLFAGKKVVLFAVPGAFTPTCSDDHLPGFLAHHGELIAKGVDLIACTAVNDHFVMRAWAKDRGVGDQLLMLADGNGDLARACDLAIDLSRAGLGTRSKRYAMVLEDGAVRYLGVEPAPGVTVSGAQAVLEALD